MFNLWQTEPVALVGSLRVLTFAVIGLVAAFAGLELSEEQLAAIAGLFAALEAVLTGAVRAAVTPVAKVANPGDPA